MKTPRLYRAFSVALAVSASALVGAGAKKPAPPVPDALKPPEFKSEEVAIPRIGTSIPGIKLRSPDDCGYFALQFGPKAVDTMYLVLDYHPRKGIYDVLYVYVQDHKKYGNAFKICGRKMEKGVVEFKAVPIETSFDRMDIEMKVSLRTKGTTVCVSTECTFKRKKKHLCRFTLTASRDPGRGRDRPAVVTRLLSPPTVKYRMDHRSTPPKLAGRLRMGVWNMIPERRMPCKLRAYIVDQKGSRRTKEYARLDEFTEGKFRFTPQRPLTPGNKYKGTVTVDMGDVFGKITVERDLIPRK